MPLIGGVDCNPPFAPDFSRCSGSSLTLALMYIKMLAESPLALYVVHMVLRIDAVGVSFIVICVRQTRPNDRMLGSKCSRAVFHGLRPSQAVPPQDYQDARRRPRAAMSFLFL